MPGILQLSSLRLLLLQMAGHEWDDWFEREEFIGQISDLRVQNLQVEREVVQKRTFTRWMNLHLEKCDPPIEVNDLFRDIQDGHILMALLEELSGCKLLHGFKKSAHRIFRLNNIAKVLSFLEERNVKLVSIDAADVADGNSSIILGLIWNIILFFQIKELTGNIRSQFPSCSSLSSIPTSSDSDASFSSTPSDERQSSTNPMREHSKAIKKLLQWVQRRTRKYGVAVQDFGKSWTSGLAFLAVIKSIDTSLVDMRKALLRTPRENLEDAFRIAHYSLGIPRLLEPEDVTLNAPDEQSIIIYVSQFLEHFPGFEEPEEPIQVIERSVSMGRLNFRETDIDHFRNGGYKGRVRERSYMFQKDNSAPPPKILISSVSEDRGIVSPPFRQAAPRSWSTEDFLSDSSHMEDNTSGHVVEEEPKKVVNEDTNNPETNSPELRDSHSPTDSAIPESLVGDSAISSPDSWIESEYNVTPEKFCESQSDSSLCDSGTAWDIYRATPVEITNSDEGLAEGRVSDEQQCYVDEGIYSLSSLESTQERAEKQEETVKGNKAANVNSGMQNEVTMTEIVHTEQATAFSDSKQLDNDKEVTEETKQNEEPVGASIVQPVEMKITDFDEEGHNDPPSAQSEIQDECQRLDSSAEAGGKSVQSPNDEIQDSFDRKTDLDEGVKICDVAESTSMGAITGITIPLISISSEPDDQELGLSDVEEIVEIEDLESKPTETNMDTEIDLENPVVIASCFITENIDLIASEELTSFENGHLDEEEFDIREISDGVQNEEALPKNNATFTQADLNVISHTDKTEEDISKSEHREEICCTFSVIDTTNTQSLEPVESNGDVVTLANDSVDMFREKQQTYTDYKRSSVNEELVDLEPMDLFYPDKEVPVFTESADADLQSWPSVLSVSPLQPAPSSQDPSDYQPFTNQQDEDSTEGDLVQKLPDNHEVTEKAFESEKTSEEPVSKEDATTDISAVQQQSPARESTDPLRSHINSCSSLDENQISPVLRHRKGVRFIDSMDSQKPVTTNKYDSDSSDYWLGNSWEPYVLLLLWLLLYCFWVLPQLDLKALPGLLFNTRQ